MGAPISPRGRNQPLSRATRRDIATRDTPIRTVAGTGVCTKKAQAIYLGLFR